MLCKRANCTITFTPTSLGLCRRSCKMQKVDVNPAQSRRDAETLFLVERVRLIHSAEVVELADTPS
jgi:hypothetical protein